MEAAVRQRGLADPPDRRPIDVCDGCDRTACACARMVLETVATVAEQGDNNASFLRFPHQRDPLYHARYHHSARHPLRGPELAAVQLVGVGWRLIPGHYRSFEISANRFATVG